MFRRPFIVAVAALALICLCQGCFTGIESTKKIELSSQDRRLLSPLPEEAIMNSVTPLPLRLWKELHPFVVTDSRASVAFAHTDAEAALEAGDTLFFNGVSAVLRPDNKEYAVLKFVSSKGITYSYNSGKEIANAPDAVTSHKIPMLADIGMISTTDSLISGKSVWNKTRSAYNRTGERIDILNYSALKIDSVSAGSGFFPLKVWVTLNGESALDSRMPYAFSPKQNGSNGSFPAFFYMDFNSSFAESRPFQKLFSLTDPRLNHQSITDTVWEAIRRGKVMTGMTKEECRMSLGNPSDASAGRNYTSTIDLWQYPDGTFLRFADGLLESFKQY